MAHALLGIRNLAWQTTTRFGIPSERAAQAKLSVPIPLWPFRGLSSSHDKKPGLLRQGQSWTQEEIDQLWQLRSTGKSFKEIGIVLQRSDQAIERRAASGMRSTARIKHAPWTEAEKKLLIERYQQGVPRKSIADELGRRLTAVANKLRRVLPPSTVSTGRLGQPAPRRWTQDELDRAFAMHAEGEDYGNIGTALGRTRIAVRTRLTGVWGKANPKVLNQSNPFTPAEDQELRRLCGTLTCFKDVAEAMPSREYGVVLRRAKRLGILSTRRSNKPWTDAELDLLRTLKLQRLSYDEIALQIPSRTVKALQVKAGRLRDLNS